MKIVIHTQYYPPEMGAPQARLSDLARRLKTLGHEVRVLTAMPNYPTGRVFSGYGAIYQKEELDGICLQRAGLIPSKRSVLWHRLVNYLSFCFSSLAVGLVKIGRPDIILTESPPLFLAFSGWLLATLKGARWIMNVSDLWPDSARHVGMLKETGLPYRSLKALAHFLYRQAWLVTGQSQEITREIVAQVPAALTYHLANGVDPETFSPALRKEEIRARYLRDGELGFVYAGLHGLFQGLDQILRLAESMQDKNVRFLFFGDGPQKEWLQQTSQASKLKNVDFYPPLPHADMPALLASLDVAVIPLVSRIVGAVPSKIYEAMASGMPILLVAAGEAREILETAGAGLAVNPGDLDGLVLAAKGLAADPELRQRLGRAGRQQALNRYNRGEVARKFERELRRRMQVASLNSFKDSSCSLMQRRIRIKGAREVSFMPVRSINFCALPSATCGLDWEEDGQMVDP